MTCEKEQFVHAYHDGQFAPSQRADFETHLRQCPSCAQLLRDLQGITRMIGAASLPEVSPSSAQRYYRAWKIANQRGLLRISTWLTTAAAAVLVGSLALWPERSAPDVTIASRPSNWELVAMMPPPERTGDRSDELIELAQWMADDLSTSAH
jgi:anti-sigma factor RsiW